MYKLIKEKQIAFQDFNQPLGLKMNPENRWIKIADLIPWNQLEEKYAALFPSETGNVAKPSRIAFGSLIIQTRYGYSDEELVEQIIENAYYQYFIGLSGYQDKAPFDSSTLVAFRNRITFEMLAEANECMLKMYTVDDNNDDSGSGVHQVKNLKQM